MLGGLSWVGARGRWVLAVGVVLATFLPALSSFLRPYFPALVALIFCLAMARLDLAAVARRAARPGRLAILALWTLALGVATPALVWTAARAAGLPEAHLPSLVYTFAAPPITSASALCLLLGLDAAFALELTIFATLATPFVGPMVTKALLGAVVPIDALALSLRITAMIGIGTLSALALRRIMGGAAIERHRDAFDGVTTIVLVIFVIPLFDGFWDIVLSAPLLAFAAFALAVGANWGAQALCAPAIRRLGGPALAGAAGLMWGNRNVSLYFAALPHDPVFGLYVALYQFPMLFTPAVMRRVLAGRASPVPGPGR